MHYDWLLCIKIDYYASITGKWKRKKGWQLCEIVCKELAACKRMTKICKAYILCFPITLQWVPLKPEPRSWWMRPPLLYLDTSLWWCLSSTLHCYNSLCLLRGWEWTGKPPQKNSVSSSMASTSRVWMKWRYWNQSQMEWPIR